MFLLSSSKLHVFKNSELIALWVESQSPPTYPWHFRLGTKDLTAQSFDLFGVFIYRFYGDVVDWLVLGVLPLHHSSVDTRPDGHPLLVNGHRFYCPIFRWSWHLLDLPSEEFTVKFSQLLHIIGRNLEMDNCVVYHISQHPVYELDSSIK